MRIVAITVERIDDINTDTSQSTSTPLSIRGRLADTLAALIEAGSKGLTTLERPAPRWSDYVHSLRHKHGIDIETLWEHHDGAFPGRHGRYVLKTRLRIVSVVEAPKTSAGLTAGGVR